jgi:hypothetical protein
MSDQIDQHIERSGICAKRSDQYGGVLARFEDSEGASVTVNGKQGDRQD